MAMQEHILRYEIEKNGIKERVYCLLDRAIIITSTITWSNGKVSYKMLKQRDREYERESDRVKEIYPLVRNVGEIEEIEIGRDRLRNIRLVKSEGEKVKRLLKYIEDVEGIEHILDEFL